MPDHTGGCGRHEGTSNGLRRHWGKFGLTVDRSRKAASRGKASSKGQAEEQAATNPQVSNALRSAYEEAVKEEVPAEFLDLLNKLS